MSIDQDGDAEIDFVDKRAVHVSIPAVAEETQWVFKKHFMNLRTEVCVCVCVTDRELLMCVPAYHKHLLVHKCSASWLRDNWCLSRVAHTAAAYHICYLLCSVVYITWNVSGRLSSDAVTSSRNFQHELCVEKITVDRMRSAVYDIASYRDEHAEVRAEPCPGEYDRSHRDF